ncbi:class I SAM-dependent methyltransferase [Maribacter antarcticus]|uniref:class I SAM-dependent methyltransferase n=1 Tax=Maribacter antarcticus TaxID=505250 RepID=UPI0006844B7B|nr:class I SAM-dependent methyltransferase [Maribacter antarcticus]
MVVPSNTAILNLAEQLRCPKGEAGKDLGSIMYESNKGMIIDSIAVLRIKDKNRILEIGPGSCAHLNVLFRQAANLRYFGLEISQVMVDEANKINCKSVSDRIALFLRYDGIKIPYVHNFFDRILTVNTIYFWQDPKAFLCEIYRVLKPDGICVVTFVEGSFMKDKPFVDESFGLYDIAKFANLVSEQHFKSLDIQTRNEDVKDKTGIVVNRPFLVATLQKVAKYKSEKEDS